MTIVQEQFCDSGRVFVCLHVIMQTCGPSRFSYVICPLDLFSNALHFKIMHKKIKVRVDGSAKK